MKFSRLAPRANPCGALHPRVFTPASPDGDPHFSKLERFRNLLGLLSFSLCTFSAAQTWSPEVQTGISRYLVSYGTSPGAHTTTVDVGAQPGFTLTGLQEGVTYYAVVTAVSTTGVMSQPSAEISYKVPVTSVTPAYVISRNGWRLHYVDSQEGGSFSGAMAFDGDPNTFWHTAWTTGTTPQPHVIQIDLGMDHPVSGFRYLPRQDGNVVGNIVQYEFLTSLDGIVWSGPAASGSFAADGTEKEVLFPSRQARFVMLRSLSEANVGNDTNIAELNILESEITVNPVNQAPVADAKSTTTQEDQSANITLSGSDADGDAISYQIISGPGKGNLTGIAPNLIYLPAADYSGSDQFSYTVNDGQVDSAPATVTISISAVNDAPVATAKSVSTNEDLPVSIVLSGTDKENSPLSYTVVSLPGKGSLTGVAPNLTYTPNPDANGDDSFTYKVSDGSLQSSTATVLISIAALNDAPVAQSGGVTTNEDTAVSVTLLASDKEGATLNYSILSSPTKGSLTGTAPNLVYTPQADVNGTDSFTYNVNDGRQFSNTGTITIQIVAVNDTPVALARSVATSEELAVAVTLAGTDKENSTLSYSIASQPTKGSLSGTAPNLMYTPALNAHGSDSFTYRVSDGSLTSTAATVSISITPVNDAPVAHDRSASTSQGAPVAVTLSANDVDRGSLSYAIITPPTKGSLSGAAPNLTYTPNAGFEGTDSFSYRASDGSLTSNTATVSISISATNDAPVAQSGGATTNEDTTVSVTLSASDKEGATLTYTILSSPTKGTLTGIAPNLVFIPHADVSGTDSFTFNVSDGQQNSNTATITIQIVAVNDTPVALAKSVDTSEELAVAVTLSGTDKENSILSYSIASQPTKGSLSGTAPNLIYTPALNANGSDSFTYLVNDGSLTSTAATVSISITPVNDAPVAQDRSASTSQGASVAAALSASDVDGGSLSYVIVTPPAKGTLSGVAPNLVYTPSAGSKGADSFSYRASDGSLTSNIATVSISISPVNQAPVAVAGVIRTIEDTAAPIILNASDPDGDLLGYIIQQGPQNGVLSGIAPNLIYTPDTGFIGTDSFTFQASDRSLQSNTATIAIEVVSDGLSDDSKLIDRNGWVLRYVDSEDSPGQLAAYAFDGDPDTFWHTRWQSGATPPPHEIQIDLGKLHTLEGFRYLPRQDGFTVGGIARYEFYVSLDGTTWGNPVASGTFVQGVMEQEALFAATPARFIRLRGLSEVNGAIHCSVAELNVLGTIGADLPPTAESRSFNTGEGNPTSVALVANDPENAPLIYEILSNPGKGVLTGTAPDLIYTPSAGFSGVDSFTFRVSDGKNPSAAATVSITVKPNKIDSGNRPPVFSSASFVRSAGSEGVTYRGESLNGTATDPDLGDGLSFSKSSGPSWLRIAVNGSLSGTPPAGSEGQNRFTIRVTDEAGATDTAQLLIDIKAARLPLPWEAEKIGDVAGQLLATHDSGTFTMEGKGTLSGASDAANFVWQMLSGDGEIIARISGMSEGDGLSRAGVMIRDSLAPNSKHVFMGVNGSGDFRMVRRNQKGNPALGKSAGKGSFPEAWVRLVRKNDTITSYKSNNGSDWKRVGTYKVDFSAHCYIGLSMSGGKGNSATATFRNVKVKD